MYGAEGDDGDARGRERERCDDGGVWPARGSGRRSPVASPRPSPPPPRRVPAMNPRASCRPRPRRGGPCRPGRSRASPRDTREPARLLGEVRSPYPAVQPRGRRALVPLPRPLSAVGGIGWVERWGRWARARNRTRENPRRGPARACAPCSRPWDARSVSYSFISCSGVAMLAALPVRRKRLG